MSRELVAAEGLYHRSCYRSYTRGKPDSSCDKEDDEQNPYDAAEKDSFNQLFSYIRNILFPNPEVLPMTDLMSRLVTCMNSFIISQIKDSTKKCIHRRLESEFAETLHIFQDNNGRLLLYPDSLSMHELAKVTYSLKMELNNMKSMNIEDAVTKAALQMREDITKQNVSQVWPPDIEHINGTIPESATHFLHTLLSGECECSNPSERVRLLSTSFVNDLVYAVSCGKNKPPKQILLPFDVRSLTGNVELIHTLNRLGHSISYSQVEEIDTALCLQKLALSGCEVALPRNIQPSVFTTLAWDNIDRLEETISGEGISHRIAIQAKVIGPQPLKIAPSISKTKKRSIDTAALMLPTYNPGQRVRPPTTPSVDVNTTTLFLHIPRQISSSGFLLVCLTQRHKVSVAGLASISRSMIMSLQYKIMLAIFPQLMLQQHKYLLSMKY